MVVIKKNYVESHWSVLPGAKKQGIDFFTFFLHHIETLTSSLKKINSKKSLFLAVHHEQ